MPLRIYLADLTHVGNGVATEVFPLNVGLIASYATRRYGDALDIRLFKYPDQLKSALEDQAPHILGCSNYTWNSNLSYWFCRLAKSLNRDTVTVWGGTNYPFRASRQEKFLAARPDLDAHVFYEGEIAFSNLVGRALSADGPQGLWADPIPGCHFLSRDCGELVAGAPLPRIQALDSVPSPYVGGLLDGFFDGTLTPLIETVRGCPFACNFCNAGDDYFNRVNRFSSEYVREELTYIAKRAAKTGVGHATLADNNFGMIPRDAETAELLYDLQGRFGWPRSITAWTGKNSRERVIKVTRMLGDSLSVSTSVQSLDSDVLERIGRGNIKLDHYRAIADELNEQGRPQHAEVILPLPGETDLTP